MNAVIFDMDGVLVDTESISMQQIYELFVRNDFQISKQDVYSIIGTSTEASWELLGNMVEPKISSEEVSRLYYKEINNDNRDFADLKFPYVRQMIQKFKEKNIKMGIASSSSIKDIENMMKQCAIEKNIDFHISGDSLKNPKPHPDIYLKTMNNLKVQKENTIIIEDSYSGITAGKKSGAFVIAIEDKKFGINQSDADLIVTDLLDAYTAIIKRFGLE